jgi:hypothetical protein
VYINEGKPYWFSALEGSYMHMFGAARVAMAMQDNTKLVVVCLSLEVPRLGIQARGRMLE